MLLDILDDGDGIVTKKEFANGVSKLKGETRAQDLVPVAANCEQLLVLAKHTQNTCDRLAAIMDKNADKDFGKIAEGTWWGAGSASLFVQIGTNHNRVINRAEFIKVVHQ